MTVATAQKFDVDDVIRRMAQASPAGREAGLRALDPAGKARILARIVELKGGRIQDVATLAEAYADAYRPKTDDELYDMVVWATDGMRIPRKSVCPDHCSPFEFLADMYFERGQADKAGIGNRGSGKTQILGIVHALNCATKPGYTAATVGSVVSQARRCYGYVKELAVGRLSRWAKSRPLMHSTEWKNNSRIEVLTGTVTGVNSPHPVFGHFDEVELFRRGVFQEALNMAQSQDGYRAMNVLTTSWKFVRGFVTTQVIEPWEEAKREGHAPPWQVYIWCVWETTERCPHDCSVCPFSDAVSGHWDDGDVSRGIPHTRRTFESACKRGSSIEGEGKLKHSDGFLKLEDTVGRFRRLSRRMWESQQESRRPTAEGLVYEVFDEELHTCDWWEPDPEYGDISLHVDFGGTNPHACGFWQLLDVDVELDGRRFSAGTHVMFDEVYLDDGQVGNVTFGKEVNARLTAWSRKYPDWPVDIDAWRDPAARAASADWRDMPNFGPQDESHPDRELHASIPTRTPGKTPVVDSIALVTELMKDGRVVIDRMRCPSMMDELGTYRWNDAKTKPVKEDDHHMDGMRYRLWGLHRDERVGQDSTAVPEARTKRRLVNVTAGDYAWEDADPVGVVPTFRATPRKRGMR